MRRVAPLSLLCLLALSGAAMAGEPAAPAADGEGAAAKLVPAAAHWSAAGEPSDAGYRLSLVRGAVDVGLDFQRRLAVARAGDARIDSAAPAGAMLPALSFGLRSVSVPMPAAHLVDRTLGSSAALPSVSRVAIEYKPAQSQVFLNHGLGFRLGGDDRLTMRLRKGSVGIYLKGKF